MPQYLAIDSDIWPCFDQKQDKHAKYCSLVKCRSIRTQLITVTMETAYVTSQNYVILTIKNLYLTKPLCIVPINSKVSL